MGPDAMTLVIPLHILHVFCNEYVSVLKVLKRRMKVLKNIKNKLENKETGLKLRPSRKH